jgi:hypothetical protein
MALRLLPGEAMRKVVAVLVLGLLGALWVFSAERNQQSLGGDEATVQAQMTAVLKPTPTATL